MMAGSAKRISAILLCVLFLLFQGVALADKATITNMIVSNTRDDLLFYASVQQAFNDKMIEAIENGVPATFTFQIDVSQLRNMWFDKEIADLTVAHTIKLDKIKEEYIVTRSWEDREPVVFKSFEAARAHMTNISGMRLCKMDKLEKGAKYKIAVKAELDKLTLPFHLRYVLFFVAFWDVETDWHKLYFTY
ncbi:MAG: DUF4390 domain-containing protein [Thermodesulfobacteriota bacterium]|nr:DUF4390 domain-containing protein [Thermodesulfobacteriota bacterium]